MAADGGTVLVVEMDDVAGLMFFGFWCFFPLFLVLPFVFVFAATRSCGLFGQNRTGSEPSRQSNCQKTACSQCMV